MFEIGGKNIRFVGIGGASMSALARFSLQFGAKVSGSDAKCGEEVKKLLAMGVPICIGHDEKAVENADLVVFSSAIGKDDPELARARLVGVPTMERHLYLALISGFFSQVVAIGGTHGKTSTTAMLTHILAKNGNRFLSMIGGESVDFSNYVNNTRADGVQELKNCIFVCEACEYKRNLLALNPSIGVVTNAECDHPDCYENEDEVKKVFCDFLAKSKCKIVSDEYESLLHSGLSERDCLVCDALCNQERKERERADCACNADLKCDEQRLKNEKGNFAEKDYDKRFFVIAQGEQKDVLEARISLGGAEVFDPNGSCGKIVLKDDGEYNYRNACFALASAKALGVDLHFAIRALSDFAGVKRRFERAGEIDGAKVIFDFAHHPAEIKCALQRAKKDGDVLCVFQPHTFSRTKAYLDDFVEVLGNENNGVKTLAIMPTYPAREDESMGINSRALATAIFDEYPERHVCLLKDKRSTIDFIKNQAKGHATVMMVGAGDIYDLKESLPYDETS